MCDLRIIAVLNAVKLMVSDVKPKIVANTCDVMPSLTWINPDFEGARPIGYIMAALNISDEIKTKLIAGLCIQELLLI